MATATAKSAASGSKPVAFLGQHRRIAFFIDGERDQLSSNPSNIRAIPTAPLFLPIFRVNMRHLRKNAKNPTTPDHQAYLPVAGPQKSAGDFFRKNGMSRRVSAPPISPHPLPPQRSFPHSSQIAIGFLEGGIIRIVHCVWRFRFNHHHSLLD